MGEAVGIVELFGLVAAFAAADAGCKAADVRLEPFDKNKPANADALPVPLIVAVKFRGSVTAVEAAVEAAVRRWGKTYVESAARALLPNLSNRDTQE